MFNKWETWDISYFHTNITSFNWCLRNAWNNSFFWTDTIKEYISCYPSVSLVWEVIPLQWFRFAVTDVDAGASGITWTGEHIKMCGWFNTFKGVIKITEQRQHLIIYSIKANNKSRWQLHDNVWRWPVREVRAFFCCCFIHPWRMPMNTSPPRYILFVVLLWFPTKLKPRPLS